MIHRLRLILATVMLAPLAGRAAADRPALWAERVKSAVAVEYVTETETERQPTISMGTVIDANGKRPIGTLRGMEDSDPRRSEEGGSGSGP